VTHIRQHDLVIAAGGIGLAPLRPLIYEIVRNRRDFGQVSLLYGARRPQDLLFPESYSSWREAQIDVYVTVDVGSPDWQGEIGVVPHLLDRVTMDPERTVVLTCGPEIMMRFVSMAALGRGISPDKIYLSMERNMNCAVGLCGHCQLGKEFICKDGPVFTYARMAPYLTREDL